MDKLALELRKTKTSVKENNESNLVINIVNQKKLNERDNNACRCS